MKKILFRYFVLCVIFTILISFFILYVSQVIDDKNNIENIKLITKGEFHSVDELLKNVKPEQWQSVLARNQPRDAGPIKILPIDKLPLDKEGIKKIKNNEIVYYANEYNLEMQLAAFRLTKDKRYAYQALLDDNDIIAHQYFGWAVKLISDKLQNTPEMEWPALLSTLSKQYGYPVQVINKANLDDDKLMRLSQHHWVVDLPNKTDDKVQVLYVPLQFENKILVFGPIILPFVGVYKKYILFISAFLAIEFIIFLLAILFVRSLEKLKFLANEYGHGRFESQIKFSKTSTLYPLYNNLKIMGKRINNLMLSHKDLINSVSHELRTPISRIRFSLELLKEVNNDTDIKNRTSAIEEDIVELETLVSEILDYAKLDRAEPTIEFNKIQLKNLLYTAINQFIKSFPEKIIIVNISNEIENITISANEKYSMRVFQNLLQNAGRFANSTVKLNFSVLNSHYFQISIEDDGPGIPIQDRQRIFEPFVQLKQQPNEISRGFGFGLAITKKILEQHGWKIAVKDSDMGGTKMIISIED